jgi:drug/metabolite transporter (DMT)-like permease
VSHAGATAGLGLASAASWGGSDFAGGLGAQRAPALLVALSGHAVSFLVLLVVCGALRIEAPAAHSLLYAALGGFEGALALAIFYRALAMGGMGLTAALAGLLTALIPVLFSALHDGLPAPLTAAGLMVGCAAIWLITRRRDEQSTGNVHTPRSALLLGACAGVGFGSQLVFFKIAGAGNLLWVMAVARAAGVAALAITLLITALLRPAKRLWRGFWFMGIVAGGLDTTGNLLYIRASQLGRMDTAAVICSLYPAGTILLASLVLREHPTQRQWVGMALALVAVALLSQ